MTAKNKAGRPKGSGSRYTPEIAKEICERLAKGESLQDICKDKHMPAASTVCLWNIDNLHGFSEQYARARRSQAELMANEILKIADDTSKDEFGELGIPNNVSVQRHRLMVDTRKWYLSKVLPKVYGDKLALTDADGTGPVQFVTKSILEDK